MRSPRWPRWPRWSRLPRIPRWLTTLRARDVGVTGLLLIWGLPDVPWWWEYPGHAGTTPVILGSLALTLTMSVPFLWRRRFPLAVLALTAGVLAVRAALHRDVYSAFAAVLAACYGLGAYQAGGRPYARTFAWLAAAAAVVVVTVKVPRTAAVPFALLAAALAASSPQGRPRMAAIWSAR